MLTLDDPGFLLRSKPNRYLARRFNLYQPQQLLMSFLACCGR